MNSADYQSPTRNLPNYVMDGLSPTSQKRYNHVLKVCYRINVCYVQWIVDIRNILYIFYITTYCNYVLLISIGLVPRGRTWTGSLISVEKSPPTNSEESNKESLLSNRVLSIKILIGN